MAQLDEDFDASTVEPRDNFDPVPPGRYAVEIIESDTFDTKSGKAIKLTLKIIEGDFEERRIWVNCINYKNDNEICQRIGQQEFAEILRACGMRERISDTSDLHNIPMFVKTRIKKDEKYGEQCVVTRYEPYDAASAPEKPKTVHQTAPAQNKPATAQKASGGTAPWRK